MEDTITFIIPTIGRESLLDSIESIKNQNNNNWRIIIVFDGIKNNFKILDNKIEIYEINKKGKSFNEASEVRKFGISKVKSKWIGFLDDDDTISNDFVDIFLKENKILNFDIYIFRMNMDNRIIPSINEKTFKICDVGISFVLNKNVFNNINFENSPTEDFDFLKKAESNNYRIIISNHVTYFVKKKDKKTITFDISKKIFINGFNPFLFVSLNYLLIKSLNINS